MCKFQRILRRFIYFLTCFCVYCSFLYALKWLIAKRLAKYFTVYHLRTEILFDTQIADTHLIHIHYTSTSLLLGNTLFSFTFRLYWACIFRLFVYIFDGVFFYFHFVLFFSFFYIYTAYAVYTWLAIFTLLTIRNFGLPFFYLTAIVYCIFESHATHTYVCLVCRLSFHASFVHPWCVHIGYDIFFY